jgi:hypothetical protein
MIGLVEMAGNKPVCKREGRRIFRNLPPSRIEEKKKGG